MPYSLEPFADIGLNEALLRFMIDEHERLVIPEYERLWSYYRNPSEAVEIRDVRGRRTVWRPAQAEGLPARLTQAGGGGVAKEIVIENDIGWRIESLVNYVAGGDVRILSRAQDRNMRAIVEGVAATVIEASGGHQFIQDVALQASVYGHVDLLLRHDRFGGRVNDLRTEGSAKQISSGSGQPTAAEVLGTVLSIARRWKIEMVEAPRAIPILDLHDYKRLIGFIVHYRRWSNEIDEPSFLKRTAMRAGLLKEVPAHQRGSVEVTEILTSGHHQIYEDEQLVHDGVNPLGFLPVAHIQNLTQPYFYEGLSDVEPLIALQDELNTRLSDRANRVTLQSFKMYLGKGIEGFGERPVSPGQMWMTDNPDASIETFGGDAASPSEDRHIEDIRAGMDKASSVSPLAAGLLRNKVGTLSSENALRISLLGILAKTERKRRAIGQGLKEVVGFVLQLLDQTGAFESETVDRECDVVWESPLPTDETKELENALIKRDLGVSRERILAELGYGEDE